MLQAIDTCQGREYWARVDQNLRVLTAQAIDAHLCKTTVLARIFDTHTRLERQSLRQSWRRYLVQEVGIYDVYKCWSLATLGGVAVCRYYNRIDRNLLLGGFEVEQNICATLNINLLGLCGVTDRGDGNFELADRGVIECVVSRSIGCSTYGCAIDSDSDIWNMLLGAGVCDVSVDCGLALIGGRVAVTVFVASIMPRTYPWVMIFCPERRMRCRRFRVNTGCF